MLLIILLLSCRRHNSAITNYDNLNGGDDTSNRSDDALLFTVTVQLCMRASSRSENDANGSNSSDGSNGREDIVVSIRNKDYT